MFKPIIKKDYSIYNDLQLTLGDRAFLTGSRAYGTPTEKSDIDIGVLVDQQVFNILTAYSEEQHLGYPSNKQVIRFGKLNIIAFTEKDRYEKWKKVNNELIEQQPVSRINAVYAFKKVLGD